MKLELPGHNRGYSKETCIGEEYLLVEWPFSTEDLAKESGPLVIRGWSDDAAVIASSSSSFILKKAETSNSLVLLGAPETTLDREKENEKSSTSVLVKSVLTSHLECVANDTSFYHRIYQMLSSNPPFQGDVEEEDLGDGLNDDDNNQDAKMTVTMDLLLDSVPASEYEIRQALRDLGAVYHEGAYILLDPFYCLTLLKYLVATATINDLDILDGSVSWSEKVLPLLQNDSEKSFLDTYPLAIVQSIISQFSLHGTCSPHFTLSKEKIIRLAARVCLAKRNIWGLDSFMAEWRDCLKSVFELDNVIDEKVHLSVSMKLNRNYNESNFNQLNRRAWH